MLRFLTSGESHGKCLVALVDGFPSGVRIDPARIQRFLDRRRGPYGRSKRMTVEKEKFEITSGLEGDITTGAPITIIIDTVDYRRGKKSSWMVPRPGHADLPGMLKYRKEDVYPIAERASARETAVRVAAGALTHILLEAFDINVLGHVIEIGGERIDFTIDYPADMRKIVESSPLYTLDPKACERMKKKIDEITEAGDTIGGVFEVIAEGVPPGLGSHVQWDRKIDGKLAMAIMAINAVKAVEIGEGIASSEQPGTLVQDEIFHDPARGYYRQTARNGGTEGGMTSGTPLIVRGFVKPIPTIKKALRSVDVKTKQEKQPTYRRSDYCVVAPASVVGEAMVSWVLAAEMVEKFGGDSLSDMKASYEDYMKWVREC
jgi:chorismate synthase